MTHVLVSVLPVLVIVIRRAAAHEFTLAYRMLREVKLLCVDLTRHRLLLGRVLIAIFRLERWMVKKGLGCIAACLLLATTSSLEPRHFALGGVAASSIQVMVVRTIHNHLLLIVVLLLVVESIELLLGLQEGALRLDKCLSIRVLLGLLLTGWDGHTADDIHEVL